MANSIPYKGLKKSQLIKMMKNAKKVSSFAGDSYVSMHKAVIREIQMQKDQNAKAGQRSMYMEVNSGYEDPLKLRGEIQTVIDDISRVAGDIVHETQPSFSQIRTFDGNLIDLQDLYELAVSNIEIAEQIEPKAEKILVRGEKAQSRKLYNIRFNMKGMMSLLLDWVILGQFSMDKIPEMIVVLIRSIGKLYDLAMAEFGYVQAIVIQEWYQSPKEDGGVEEDQLIETILQKYRKKIPDLSKESIIKAVDELVKCHCGTVENGKLFITESIVIQ